MKYYWVVQGCRVSGKYFQRLFFKEVKALAFFQRSNALPLTIDLFTCFGKVRTIASREVKPKTVRRRASV